MEMPHRQTKIGEITGDIMIPFYSTGAMYKK